MHLTKSAFAFALAILFAAPAAAAEVVPATVIQQPGAMTPYAFHEPAPAPSIQRPTPYGFSNQNPATAASAPAVIQQPVPYAFANAFPGETSPNATTSIQQPTSHSIPSPAPTSNTTVTTIQQPAPFVQPQAITQSPPVSEVTTATPLSAPPAILQPAPYAALAAPSDAATAPLIPPPIQQPSVFSAPAAPPAANASLQQPNALGLPSAFASYYDQDDESAAEEDAAEPLDENDELYDEDEDDADDCGDDVDCSDECEESNTCCGFELGGWIQQGFTFNPYDPRDGNNGTVILNDLANQYQMNQFWLYANRDVDTGGCGWDWGGRFDVLFGTDAEYFQMVDGLEESWGQTGHYQVAFLRFYYDIAYNDWTFRVGRWDTPVGYEPFDATESFFYSRSYNFYAQPGSLLGCNLTRHLNDQWSVSAGLHRGDMQFDDTDGKDSIGFIGGASWMSLDEETWVDAYLQTDEEGIGVDAIDYSVVAGTTLGEYWDYVAEWYWGQNDQFGQQSEWYGLNQHFIREINECWSHGFRFEWFRDDDGFIITDFARGNSAQGPFDGNFFELTYAINYRPCESFVLRPEIRYDWYDASTAGPLPFDDGTKSDQFLLSLDAIYAF